MPSFPRDAERGLHPHSLTLPVFPWSLWSLSESMASTPSSSKFPPGHKKLFCVSLALNIVGLIFAVTEHWEYPRRYMGAFVLGNLQAATLVRNKFFGRCLHLVINTLFAKWPLLRFCLACTSTLQHLGGIHSSCATTGAMWLVYCLVLLIIYFKHYLSSIIMAGVVTSAAVLVSITSAFPWVHKHHHNIFEGYHFIWQQDFWFAVALSICIIIPWVMLHRVLVFVEAPSPKVTVICFEYRMQQGLLARVSRGSILEYHAFGIIFKGRESQEHFLICGVQGDFTQNRVKNPPTHFLTCQLKFAKVSNTSKLHNRGIHECTRTGMGTALSTCMQLLKEVYYSWNTEVVFITSNLGGNTEMMQGCKKAGIPAFGTLWDF
ncbi:hypothetical protein B0H17DRAFT_1160595 [Mycena rosella]|uniref:Uncharacterized protein n=1 Tax=Mycena rosella TaxID=1033263 RepID=A0AAD7D9S8_MYCRO|nr:hypothetical protein B0H17DRAFT_1160595 [Mycena rosella]